MNDKDIHVENSALSEKNEEAAKKIKDLARRNKAAALGLAVFLTLSTAFTGCAARNEEEEEDDSYYVGGGGGGFHGGSYFYTRGGSYRQGSWGSSDGITGKSGYSTSRGGSIGS